MCKKLPCHINVDDFQRFGVEAQTVNSQPFAKFAKQNVGRKISLFGSKDD